jgi:hypothetical protein
MKESTKKALRDKLAYVEFAELYEELNAASRRVIDIWIQAIGEVLDPPAPGARPPISQAAKNAMQLALDPMRFTALADWPIYEDDPIIENQRLRAALADYERGIRYVGK